MEAFCANMHAEAEVH